MTVRWITNKLCYSWVEYGEGDNTNKVTLSNLKPGPAESSGAISATKKTFELRMLKEDGTEVGKYTLNS